MSRRERAAPGGPKGTSRAGDGSVARPPIESSQDPGNHRQPNWEEIYRGASRTQQQELLALAERQGLVYAHQLPTSTNGAALESERRLLGRILSGQIADLETVHPDNVEFRD